MHSHGVQFIRVNMLGIPGTFHTHSLQNTFSLTLLHHICAASCMSSSCLCVETQWHICRHSYGVPWPHSLAHRDGLKIEQPHPESCANTVIQSHTASHHTVTQLPRVLTVTHTEPLTVTALQSQLLKNSFSSNSQHTHNRHPDPTLSYNLTAPPPPPTRPLSWAPAAASHSFSSFCFSFLLFPLRNLVPVRKPKPFPAQGPGQAGVAR